METQRRTMRAMKMRSGEEAGLGVRVEMEHKVVNGEGSKAGRKELWRKGRGTGQGVAEVATEAGATG